MSWSNLEKIEIELSGDCNAACPLCPRTELNIPLRGNGNHTLEDVKKSFGHLIDKFNQLDEFEIALYGLSGDPILNPECYEITKWFTENGATVIISTNGGYNNADWWHKLGKLNNLIVKWAIDGAEKTNHLYRINVVWDIVMRNLKSFIDAGGTACWVFIPFDHNMEEFEVAKQIAQDLKIDFESKTSGRNAQHEALDKVVQVNKHKKKEEPKTRKYKQSKSIPHVDTSNLKKIRKELDNLEEDKNYDTQLIEDAVDSIECKSLKNSELYVGANKKLYPCCFLHDLEIIQKQPWDKSLPENWNSLSDYSMDNILSQKPFTDLQERMHPDHQNFVSRCLRQCSDKNSHQTVINKIIRNNYPKK